MFPRALRRVFSHAGRRGVRRVSTLSAKRQGGVVNLCQQLIRAKSYSGEEGEAAACLAEAFQALGFDSVHVDELGSVIGSIHGKHSGRTVLLDGHLDTVPVEAAAWTHDPFAATLKDGRVWGRGTSDMKGAIACMACAAAHFAEDTNREFSGTISVAGCVHEECFEGVAAREISKRVQPDFVVIGEASNLTLKRGQRGRAEVVLETIGQPAHSSNPDAGVNAVYQMAELIPRVKELPSPTHPILGPGILELTDIVSAPFPGASVVPERCTTTWDRRLLVGEDEEAVLGPLRALLHELNMTAEQGTPGSASVNFASGTASCYTGATIHTDTRFFPGWLHEEGDEVMQRGLRGLEKAGMKPELGHYAFCTNGSHYAGEAGIPCVGFGPSLERLAHVVDEYVDVAQLHEACRGYHGLVAAFLE